MGPDDSFVRLEVSTDSDMFVPIERSFSKNISIRDLKMKLELLTGIAGDGMKISLLADDAVCHQDIGDDSRSLSSFLPGVWENKLRVRVTGVSLGSGDVMDGETVKFELTDEAYESRAESLRKFKQQQNLGRFNPEAAEAKRREHDDKIVREAEAAKNISVGNRVEVRVAGNPTRRGTVKFVGQTHFKPGIPMIGVQYDEPMGKNDGSVAGQRYFTCPDKYGSFVKPTDVVVGDFPEDDPFAME